MVRSEIDTLAVPDGPVNCVAFVSCVPFTLTWNVIVDVCGKLDSATEAWSQLTSGGPVATYAL